jgi:hypothetical protein
MSLLNRAAYSLRVISIAFNPADARRVPANQAQPAQEKKEQATRLKTELIEVRVTVKSPKQTEQQSVLFAVET